MDKLIPQNYLRRSPGLAVKLRDIIILPRKYEELFSIMPLLYEEKEYIHQEEIMYSVCILELRKYSLPPLDQEVSRVAESVERALCFVTCSRYRPIVLANDSDLV